MKDVHMNCNEIISPLAKRCGSKSVTANVVSFPDHQQDIYSAVGTEGSGDQTINGALFIGHVGNQAARGGGGVSHNATGIS